MRNDAIQETDLTSDALRSVAELLPARWTLEARASARVADRELDAIVDLIAPNGQRVSFAVEAKRSGAVAIPYLLAVLREVRARTRMPVLYVSDYIGPSLRAALAEEGLSFADATGWVEVSVEEPLVVLAGNGAQRSPRPSRSGALVRLNGVAANRIIRALTTGSATSGVRDLAELAEVSPGSVSKLLATLAAEGVVDRDDRGKVIAVRRAALIRRWARDYAFTTANRSVGHYIAPRGLSRTVDRLSGSTTALAVTGSAAARRMLPEGMTSVVPLRLLALYAADPAALVTELGLIDADPPTANVMIAVPQDHRIIAPPGDDVPLAPVSLVLADLLTLPNRSDAEAEQLIDVLSRDDEAWKDDHVGTSA